MIPTIKNVDSLFYFNACNYISNKMECFKNKNKFHIFISIPLFILYRRPSFIWCTFLYIASYWQVSIHMTYIATHDVTVNSTAFQYNRIVSEMKT